MQRAHFAKAQMHAHQHCVLSLANIQLYNKMEGNKIIAEITATCPKRKQRIKSKNKKFKKKRANALKVDDVSQGG